MHASASRSKVKEFDLLKTYPALCSSARKDASLEPLSDIVSRSSYDFFGCDHDDYIMMNVQNQNAYDVPHA